MVNYIFLPNFKYQSNCKLFKL